jgi:hypothetical protein
MPRLCFRHQDTGRLIAEGEGNQAGVIPAIDDRIYVPSAMAPGMYANLRVAGRELYYDQRGALALINLECVELPAPPAAPRAS